MITSHSIDDLKNIKQDFQENLVETINQIEQSQDKKPIYSRNINSIRNYLN